MSAASSSPGVRSTRVASPVSAELRETLRASGRIRHLRRGERLVHEGGRHGSVLLLITGTVRVLSYAVDGSEVLLAIRGPGELVGDFGPITGAAATATLEAREPSEVVLTSSVRFRELAESSPAVAFDLLRRLVDMFNEAEQRLIERSTLPVSARLARELIRHTDGSSDERSVELTQEELASLCGARRGSIAAALAEMRRAGVVKTGRGSVVVLDRHLLESLSRPP